MDLWEEGHIDEEPSHPMGNVRTKELIAILTNAENFPPPQPYKYKSRSFPVINSNPNTWALCDKFQRKLRTQIGIRKGKKSNEFTK